MEIFLVGGAVRDRLLGLPVDERDYVVVGASAEEMLARGYRPVGKGFPVFLHPQTREEYALARGPKTRATGEARQPSLSGATISLEQDLARRDLTINALAEDSAGHVIDYHGGRRDLERRLLRHVSAAFAEDPIRVLRVARFVARYAEFGFTVADETQALMTAMAARGDLDGLVAERVWQELERALRTPRPSLFFRCLRACRALAHVLPEIDRLWGVPQPARWHPEIDTGAHVMMAVDEAARLSPDPTVRFAALVHDLGKGQTPPSAWPHHLGHEGRGIDLIEAMCQRLRMPRRYRQLAQHVARYHGRVHRAAELRPKTLLALLEAIDAFRRPARLTSFLLACKADYRGRQGSAEHPYPQAEIVHAAYCAARDADRSGLGGTHALSNPRAIGKELRRRRQQAIAAQRLEARKRAAAAELADGR